MDTVQLYLQKMQLLSSVKAVGSRRQDVSKQIVEIGGRAEYRGSAVLSYLKSS